MVNGRYYFHIDRQWFCRFKRGWRPTTTATLNAPAGLAIDKWGDIYIADGDNYRIRKVNNCKQAIVVAEDTCAPIIVHDVITPNGDGINDVLEIEGIQNYPKNTLQIFDKLGDMVYSKDGYGNNWGGLGNKGERLPDGTYYYLMKLNAENGTKSGNVFTGAILIKR